ncbi:hypothetical protein [Streptomyces sp. NPDC004783]|uniref:hypothetical protein n=1 Tax=Streptomyces sp. NPDC004783 TaxID=3154459 RepID=UPI0033BF5C85
MGAVTGPAAAPRTLLLGRYNASGTLRYIGRTVPLSRTATTALANVLTPAAGEHPWAGRTFIAGWGSRDVLDVTLVRPDLVVEADVDVARGAAGRWRHPVRLHHARLDLDAGAVPLFGR